MVVGVGHQEVRLKRLVTIIVLAPLVIVAVLGGFWAYQTLTITEPYDEVWIGLNSRLPDTLRAWSCGEVRGRVTGSMLAPMGCEGFWK